LRKICFVPRKILLFFLLLPPQARQQHDGRCSLDDHNKNVALCPLADEWTEWVDGWMDG
jgi:hypothetical protein